MTDKVDHSPIALGGGSYDMNELQKVTDRAAKAAKPETREKILTEEMSKARADLVDEDGNVPEARHDMAYQAGFVMMDVEREIAPGVTVKERISVYDERAAKKEGVVEETPAGKSTGGAAPAVGEGSK